LVSYSHTDVPGTLSVKGLAYLHLIVGLALLVRIGCAIYFTGEIDPEGAEYARIAENLLAGKGYSGIATEGTQLFFPPLFPFLIALVSLITGDAEAAGRSINVLFGALIAYPVFFIALRIFDRRVALGAAALVAFHPYFIQLSTTVYCEPTYLALVLAAVYSSMRVMSSPRRSAFAASGALYGLAYLVRPEAFVFMLVAMVFIVLDRMLNGWNDLRKLPGQLALLVAMFLLLAGPYIIWLSIQTGQPRLEAKSPLNVATELRIQQGLSESEATFGIDQDLTPRGIWIRPNIEVIEDYRSNPRTLMTMLAKKADSIVQYTSQTLASKFALGSPALFTLAFLGLFSQAWRRDQAIDNSHLLVLLSLAAFATFFIYYSHPRFYVLFVVVFCIWASSAIASLGRWARETAAMLGLGARLQTAASKSVLVIAAAAILLPAGKGAAEAFAAARNSLPRKLAGETLRASDRPLRIADTSTMFAFHAHADFNWLPFCDGPTALRYLQEKRVTHVVISDDALTLRPYLAEWLNSGVPGSRQIADIETGGGQRTRVYDMTKDVSSVN
jgi:4-amino-4-deoxy-L-arabinose transferase-like glycosyltransferase